MRLIKKQISAKDGSGLILIQPDTAEDLWHSFNLIRLGDKVRCTTIRKVVNETSTGSTSSTRKRFMLTIAVEKIDFDTQGESIVRFCSFRHVWWWVLRRSIGRLLLLRTRSCSASVAAFANVLLLLEQVCN